MSESLIIEERDGVAWVTLNRPERLNALSRELIRSLNHYFIELYQRDEIRVVVLRGAGRAFCAGLDLKERHGAPTERQVQEALNGQREVRDIMVNMRRCPQPIIALVQGSASGGGFALALASDIRLITPDARFNAAFIRIGLGGCDVGVSYFLPRMVGSSVAAEYLLTGRFMDAGRAHQLGLASRVDELPALEEEARSLIDDMLATTPLGLRLTKDALGLAVDLPSLEAVVALEDRNQILCVKDDNFAEGVAAFLEKRPPRYA
ncbi:enoyl-CoA hydratase/isomerase family protein [Alloalcanivorax xenomutans]|uniref:enoyl-CoA hydratase/isomerase family protein n=1 Tax=Alloalcanivorax xenomutans TaxID=1094342 RepID=UPI003D9ADC10